MRRCFFIAVIAMLGSSSICNAVAAPPRTVAFDLTIDAGKHDRINTPVSVLLDLPEGFDPASFVSFAFDRGGSAAITGQLCRPRLDAPQHGSRQVELDFILPKLAAGRSTVLHAVVMPKSAVTGYGAEKSDSFHWHDTPGDHALLTFGDRPVIDYMYHPLDDSSKAAHVRTYKVFHHVYDSTGTKLLTKGPGGQDTHHRGLFYGFNKITYGNPDDPKHADTWQCRDGSYESHEGFLNVEAGPVLGRHLLAIDWHGGEKDVFAHERRELTAYDVPGGTMIDFASELTTADGPVRIDGSDPHHAGFHFRAPNEVAAKTSKKTYFIRPDGVGKPGESRNWDAEHRDPRTVNLPWKGMSFVTGGKRYTAAILDLPTNPKEARFSERPYGRFGSYFEYNLTADHPLRVAYRFWIQDGEMTPKEIARMADDFVDPVHVVVKAQSDQ